MSYINPNLFNKIKWVSNFQSPCIFKQVSNCIQKLGSLFSSILDKFWKSQEVRILVLGLDGAGKTTILYQLQCGEVVTTVPSIKLII